MAPVGIPAGIAPVGMAVGRVVEVRDGLAPVGIAVGRVPEPHGDPLPVELIELALLEQAVITPVTVTPASAIAPTRSASGRWSRMHVLLYWSGFEPCDRTLANPDE